MGRKRIRITETQLSYLAEGTNTNGVLGKTFISYGASKYDPAKFKPVDPLNSWGIVVNKPTGGLWASPVDSKWGWADWCKSEEFKTDTLDKNFTFKLSPNAKIYVIDNLQDLIAVSDFENPRMDHMGTGINVERLMDEGYDGLYVTAKAVISFRYNVAPGIKDLNSWDVESICVFNKDVIIPL